MTKNARMSAFMNMNLVDDREGERTSGQDMVAHIVGSRVAKNSFICRIAEENVNR